MNAITTELAIRFDAAVADVVAVVERCSPAEWTTICAAEQWSVGVVVDHIGIYMLIQRDWIGKLANDEPLIPFTERAIDAFNAWRAEERAGVTQPEALDLLRRNHGLARDFILGLTAGQLRRARPFDRIVLDTGSSAPRDVARCIERTLIAHVRHHFESITATLGWSGSPGSPVMRK
jgi:hypothetical protein